MNKINAPPYNSITHKERVLPLLKNRAGCGDTQPAL